MSQTAKHIVFSGQVQGVGFRYKAREIAQQYDVTGFVRNQPDGTVEMLLQGPQDQIEACLREIRDSFAGHIRTAEMEATPYSARHTDFRITF
ncbi:MAG: acylphosphatase [Planctomycetes bacterium]|nr:acylphosphatase [Planctomycetota bacterium]